MEVCERTILMTRIDTMSLSPLPVPTLGPSHRGTEMLIMRQRVDKLVSWLVSVNSLEISFFIWLPNLERDRRKKPEWNWKRASSPRIIPFKAIVIANNTAVEEKFPVVQLRLGPGNRAIHWKGCNFKGRKDDCRE